MTDNLEAAQAREELLRAYSPGERRTIKNITQCLRTKEQNAKQEEVMRELDQMVTAYNDLNVIDHKLLLQLNTLDAMFQRFVYEGCTENTEFFKAAFIVQRLYFTTAKHLKGKCLPIPD